MSMSDIAGAVGGDLCGARAVRPRTVGARGLTPLAWGDMWGTRGVGVVIGLLLVPVRRAVAPEALDLVTTWLREKF